MILYLFINQNYYLRKRQSQMKIEKFLAKPGEKINLSKISTDNTQSFKDKSEANKLLEKISRRCRSFKTGFMQAINIRCC